MQKLLSLLIMSTGLLTVQYINISNVKYIILNCQRGLALVFGVIHSHTIYAQANSTCMKVLYIPHLSVYGWQACVVAIGPLS
jgi:hypothetical protein